TKEEAAKVEKCRYLPGNYPRPVGGAQHNAPSFIFAVWVLRGSLAELADDPRIVGSRLGLASFNNFNPEAPLVTVVVQEGHCRAHVLEGRDDARALHAARAAPLEVGE